MTSKHDEAMLQMLQEPHPESASLSSNWNAHAIHSRFQPIAKRKADSFLLQWQSLRDGTEIQRARCRCLHKRPISLRPLPGIEAANPDHP